MNKNGSPILVLIFINSKAACNSLIHFGRGGVQMNGHDEHCVELMINHTLSKSIHRLSSILTELILKVCKKFLLWIFFSVLFN